ncbi:MAG: 50S ribosomal protein L4 [Rickettsiaceae bacterium]|nr:MAG: 50S ribosomal protein L4 [Rickettsiaceae bacterium]
MEVAILNIENQPVGQTILDNYIFGLTPRKDIIKLVVDWQRAKAMAGTHQTKTISEVSGTTKKPFKQKGTGNARQGSLRSAQMRGGGVSHGPVFRSHETKLPKKVRKLGLRHALSAKILEHKLFIIDSLELAHPKTALLSKALAEFKGKSFFIVGGNMIEPNFCHAAKNLAYVSVVPQVGINVYDILKHDYVLLSSEALHKLEEKLK